MRFSGITNAHVGLFCGARRAKMDEDYTTQFFYEIVLGGWTNSLSVIRRRPCAEFKHQIEHKLHREGQEMVTVTVAFVNGDTIVVSMGEVPGENVFMTWTDPRPMSVTHIALMTGWEPNDGMDWEFKPVETPIKTFERCEAVPKCPGGCRDCDVCEVCTDCEDYYQFMKAKGTCAKCPDNCRQCDGGKCSECAPKTYWNEIRECVRECPEGFFGDKDTGACTRCHEACSLCYGADISECTACNAGY